MTAKQQQIETLKREIRAHGVLKHAAEAAGMDPATARKYLRIEALEPPPKNGAVELPAAAKIAHEAEIYALFEANHFVTARALLEHLMSAHPGMYHDGQLSTVSRRLRTWRELHGVRVTRKPRRRPSAAIVVLEIYDELRKGPRAVDELAERLGMPGEDLSRYVQIIEQSGRRVERRRQGKRSLLRLVS